MPNNPKKPAINTSFPTGEGGPSIDSIIGGAAFSSTPMGGRPPARRIEGRKVSPVRSDPNAATITIKVSPENLQFMLSLKYSRDQPYTTYSDIVDFLLSRERKTASGLEPPNSL